MDSQSKQSQEPLALDLDRLRSFDPADLLKTVLVGLTDGICLLVPEQIELPEETARELAARWRDTKFQADLRSNLQQALATALKQKLPATLADPVATYLTDKILYPAIKAAGDRLLERFGQKAATSGSRPKGQPRETS
jgi:hypothetical protein